MNFKIEKDSPCVNAICSLKSDHHVADYAPYYSYQALPLSKVPLSATSTPPYFCHPLATHFHCGHPPIRVFPTVDLASVAQEHGSRAALMRRITYLTDPNDRSAVA